MLKSFTNNKKYLLPPVVGGDIGPQISLCTTSRIFQTLKDVYCKNEFLTYFDINHPLHTFLG